MTAKTSQSYDVIIVGGGAAGFFAAVTCAEHVSGARVIILERSPQVLSKVKVSGGGRCNVTHACFDPQELIGFYPRGGRELLGPFHTWSPVETVGWFERHGVALKEEDDGRMFPTTDDSRTIVECLESAASRLDVTVKTSVSVQKFSKEQDGFRLLTKSGGDFFGRSLILATGGLKEGSFAEQIRAFGHVIEPIAPSLFTFHIDDERLSGLAGLSIPRVSIAIEGAKLASEGPMLVTHWGVSGPAVLKLSSWGARWMQARDYRFVIRVNWTGSESGDSVRERFESMRRSTPRKQIRSTALFDVPRRLWERLVAQVKISTKETWAGISSASLRSLAVELTDSRVEVAGKSMNKEEFVTCGGVRLSEIRFKTMESKRVEGLYFAGEILDIDALTGGFNFQSAWTTGYLAGRAVAGRE